MKTETLLWAMDLLKPAILDQEIIPVLRHVCFRNGTAVAFNDIIGVVVPFEFEEGNCCVPGMTLHSFLSSVSNKGSELNIRKAGEALNIKAGRSRVELPVLDVREFFFDVPEFRAALEFAVEEGFIEALEYVTPAVGDASMTSMELGVVLSAHEGSSAVQLYATDNLMLSSATTDTVGREAEKSVACILPKDFCMRLVALCSILDESPVVQLSEHHVIADYIDSGVVLYSKTVEPLRKGRLADDVEEAENMIRNILGSSQDDPLQMAGMDGIATSLKRAAIFVRGDIDGMVTFSGDEGGTFVRVEAGTDKTGNIEDKVSVAECVQSSFRVTVKLQQMLDAVEKTGENSVIPTTEGALTFTYEDKEISLLTLVAYKEDSDDGEE